MHLEDEQVQRLLHGELDPRAEEAAIEHSGSCAICRERIDEAEREEEQIFELFRRLDHEAPAVDAENVAARARRGVGVGRRTTLKSSAGIGGRRAPSWVRWAAGILLALGAVGVAYAAPGSPLPAWLSRLARSIESPAPHPAPVAQSTTPDPDSAGIAVAPSERFVIDFATTQAEGIVTVSLTEGSEITARALNGIASFTSDVDRLTIENGGSTADYQIDLPRDARWVEIRLGEQRLLLKRGDRLVTAAERDSQGRYILPLTPPGR